METYELTPHPREPHREGTVMEDEPQHSGPDARIQKNTVKKLDVLLLPFLSLLFLFNSLDKSNAAFLANTTLIQTPNHYQIGNAESAHFTSNIGLHKDDLNTAVALFFAVFVSLQPLGAALGRRYGMVAWVPSCMALWGVSTALHIWVKTRWQLFTLRIIIGCLEAGFYPVTVSYLSLFYTRFEFARRLSLFYGQAAMGGALGGILSYLVFSRFPGEQHDHEEGALPDNNNGWKSWQVLFLLEGVSTIIVALVGYLWLPHGPSTAWFLSDEERTWAEERIRQDRTPASSTSASPHATKADDEEDVNREESHGLLGQSHASSSSQPITDDRGLTPHDILSALLSPKIYHILLCNILSSIPIYAFSVFLPLVLAPLTGGRASPALVNLMTAPPFICGAIALYLFASYSDRHQIRIMPILTGLGVVIVGLTLTVAMPHTKGWAIPRYLALNVLISGCFVASPLTVAWISGNTPSPGKRAVLLGINGWGNLAGVLSALLFRPKYAKDGYIVPFWWTLVCVGCAAVGFWLFWRNLAAENERRRALLRGWDEEDIERERCEGRGPLGPDRRVVEWVARWCLGVKWLEGVGRWIEAARDGGRNGDERITFVYGL